nr:hypothetical protein [Natrinema sp. CBA1119]
MEYDPEQFPTRVSDSRSERRCPHFLAGNIVSTGANSEEAVQESLTIGFAALRELGITVMESPTIEIQNIVSSVDFRHQLNLNAIAIGLGLEVV